MKIETIKTQLKDANIFHSEEKILDHTSVIGYEKLFKWKWIATQLNTFIVATDLGNKEITPSVIESHLTESFSYAKDNYTGWPKGLQSGLGVICILISDNLTEEAKEYCIQLKSGKKWAGFSIPVLVDSNNDEVFQFEKDPMWGKIYYPHFKKLIHNLKGTS